jgi:nitrate reductase beta subunit
MFSKKLMTYIRTNIYQILKAINHMDISESKSLHGSLSFFDQEAVPKLLNLVQYEIKTVIPSESNEHLSVKKTKTSSCGLNYKSLLQFGSMTIKVIFQIIILYKEYKWD